MSRTRNGTTMDWSWARWHGTTEREELGAARHHAYDDGIAAIIFIVQAENVEKCVMAVVPGDAGECLAERSG